MKWISAWFRTSVDPGQKQIRSPFSGLLGAGEQVLPLSLFGGTIAYSEHDGNDHEIHYWDGAVTIQLTNNEYDDYMPSLRKGSIAWARHDRNDWEIYFIDQIRNHSNEEVFPWELFSPSFMKRK